MHGRLAFERQRLTDGGRRLGLGVRHLVQAERGSLIRNTERIQATTRHGLAKAHTWLQTQSTRQRLLDPKRVLERGYALARGPDGRILTDIQKIKAGMELSVQFRDGRARTKVEDVEAGVEDIEKDKKKEQR